MAGHRAATAWPEAYQCVPVSRPVRRPDLRRKYPADLRVQQATKTKIELIRGALGLTLPLPLPGRTMIE
jgi:hypothetical protein